MAIRMVVATLWWNKGHNLTTSGTKKRLYDVNKQKKQNMNNKNRLIWMCGATLLMFASCSQDETQTGDNPAKGICPVEIGGVTVKSISSEEQQTRMTENDEVNTSSVFENGEQITISANNGTETRTETYQIETVSGSDSYSISAVDGQGLYWESISEQLNITAWYPIDTETEIDLSDQSSGLKYVLKATATVSYGSSVPLSFSHQLAKISVELTRSKADAITNVEIYGYTACTNTMGTVAMASDAQQGWIKMMKKAYTSTGTRWEANVVPGQQISQMRITTSSGNSYTYSFDAISPSAGMLYYVMLRVYGTDDNVIDLSKLTGNTTISTNSTLINETAYKVTVASGVSITLDDATINNQLEFKGGNSTLTLSGTNKVAPGVTQTSAILLSGAGTLTIAGTSSDVLEATGRNYLSCGIEIRGADANLEITGGRITAKNTGTGYAAGIGSSPFNDGGNITISGGTITATGGPYAPGIGASTGSTCKDITISGGRVTATGGSYAAGIGNGTYGAAGETPNPYSSVGTITIKNYNTRVIATGGSNSTADIGNGYTSYCSCTAVLFGYDAYVNTSADRLLTTDPYIAWTDDDY